MASMTSIISIFALLLATYCYSAPIGTEFQFSTVENEFTSVTPKPIEVAIEFITVPNTHAKRSEHLLTEKFTTERSIPEVHNSNKRTLSDEFTTVTSFTVPMVHKRSGEEVDVESLPEVTNGDVDTKRSVEEPVKEESTDDKRSVEEPVKEESTDDKRSVEVPVGEESTDDKRSVGEWTTEKIEVIDGKKKRTEEHIVPKEFFTTEESSTDFNNRVVRLMEHEAVGLELTTIPESSSFETLAHTTGLLKQRNVPVHETEDSKGETRDTENFRANDLSTFNQTAHEQYSSSFNDESILLLFLLAALLFCIIFVASFIVFNRMKKNLQRQSPINEMEAELDKQYDQHES